MTGLSGRDPAPGSIPGPHGLGEFVRDLFHLNRARFDLAYGVRAAVFVVVPLFLGIWTGSVEVGVLATFGTLNLFMIQAPRPGATPVRILALGVGTNAVAFAAGTLVGTTSGLLEILLVGTGVFVALLGKRYAPADSLTLIGAVLFVVAVGLPGTDSDALPRGAWVLLGGLWAMVAVLLPLRVRWLDRPLPVHPAPAPPDPAPGRVTLTYSAVVAITAASGLAVGGALGLPRDYWVMLTILVALRPDLSATFGLATTRVLGTVLGATVAFLLTAYVADPWVLGAFAVAAAAATFATRAVNYTVYAVAITVFVILLLNLAFSSGPAVAVDRVLDTALGGALALIAAAALWSWGDTPRRWRAVHHRGVPPHPV
jgi:hypothetical protein